MSSPKTKGHKVHDTTKMLQADIDKLCEEAKKEAEETGQVKPLDSAFDLSADSLADD